MLSVRLVSVMVQQLDNKEQENNARVIVLCWNWEVYGFGRNAHERLWKLFFGAQAPGARL